MVREQLGDHDLAPHQKEAATVLNPTSRRSLNGPSVCAPAARTPASTRSPATAARRSHAANLSWNKFSGRLVLTVAQASFSGFELTCHRFSREQGFFLSSRPERASASAVEGSTRSDLLKGAIEFQNPEITGWKPVPRLEKDRREPLHDRLPACEGDSRKAAFDMRLVGALAE